MTERQLSIHRLDHITVVDDPHCLNCPHSWPTVLEPWVPSLDQRVRVRLNGECQFSYSADGTEGDSVNLLREFRDLLPALGHAPQLDGRPGRVVAHVRSPQGDDGHRYYVRLDHGVALNNGTRTVFLDHEAFAAVELEPVE